MRVRTFIIVFLSLVVLIFEAAPVSAQPGKGRTSGGGEFRGAWIYDPRALDPEKTMACLSRAGFNNVFVRLSSGGAAYYPSKVMPSISGTRDYARLWMEAAHRRGIKIHAWHVCFMMHNASASSMKRIIKRGEAMMDYKGRVIRPSYQAVVRSPAADATLDFEKAAMVELATQYDLDGVQFDYIRYPIYSVDYSPAAKERFEADKGRPVKNWPWDVSKGSRRAEYQRWKMDVVTQLLKEVSRSIRAANHDIKISAAVWNDPEVGGAEYGQDWPRWVRESNLDFICPMDYTTRESTLRRWLQIQKKIVGGRIPIYPGLGVYLLKTPEQLNRQIQIVRTEGLPGYVLYNCDRRTMEDFLPDLDD